MCKRRESVMCLPTVRSQRCHAQEPCRDRADVVSCNNEHTILRSLLHFFQLLLLVRLKGVISGRVVGLFSTNSDLRAHSQMRGTVVTQSRAVTQRTSLLTMLTLAESDTRLGFRGESKVSSKVSRTAASAVSPAARPSIDNRRLVKLLCKNLIAQRYPANWCVISHRENESIHNPPNWAASVDQQYSSPREVPPTKIGKGFISFTNVITENPAVRPGRVRGATQVPNKRAISKSHKLIKSTCGSPKTTQKTITLGLWNIWSATYLELLAWSKSQSDSGGMRLHIASNRLYSQFLSDPPTVEKEVG
jgi:hypothetical protein